MPKPKIKQKAGRRTDDSPPTWWAKRKTFRKRLTIGGKQREFYFKYPNTEKGQALAGSDWLRKLAELKHAEEIARYIEKFTNEANQPGVHPDWQDTMRLAVRDLEDGKPLEEVELRAATAMAARGRVREGRFAEAAEFYDNLDPIERRGKPMVDVLEEFRVATQRRLDSGEIGKTRNAAIRRWVKRESESDFGQTAIPEDEPQLGRLVSDYRDQCLDELKSELYGKAGFDDRMRECRQFIVWACSQYLLPREPRNLKAAFRKFNERTVTAKAIDLDDLKKLWKAADGKMKAIIALSLNCGFYAVEYSYVTPAMLSEGRLNFKRQKTQKQANNGRGVSVSYPLWDITARLIERHGNKTGDYLLADDYGQPLYIERENSREDKIYRAFKVLCDQAGVTGYTFSHVRDTGSTLIEEIDSTFTDTYGAHMDQRIAAFYIDGAATDKKRLYAKFDIAIEELGQRLADVLV